MSSAASAYRGDRIIRRSISAEGTTAIIDKLCVLRYHWDSCPRKIRFSRGPFLLLGDALSRRKVFSILLHKMSLHFVEVLAVLAALPSAVRLAAAQSGNPLDSVLYNDASYFTTNFGLPVSSDNASLTVGARGTQLTLV